PIVIPLLDLAEIALAEGIPCLRVRVTAPDGRSVGAKPEARRDLPVIEVADTTQERVVARERPLPPFELDGVPRAGHLVFSLGEGLAELSPEPVVEFRARIP